MSQLQLQVVIVVAFGAFCLGFKRGVARYNWHTGKWEWGEPPEEPKTWKVE